MLVTLEIVRRAIVAEGTLRPALPGDPPKFITVTPKRARQLVDARVCRVVPAAPAPEAAVEKKPSGAKTADSSTGELSLTAPGSESAPSSSAAAPRSRRSRRSARDAAGTPKEDASASSQ